MTDNLEELERLLDRLDYAINEWDQWEPRDDWENYKRDTLALRNAAPSLIATTREVEGLRAHGQFLIDRLLDLDWSMDADDLVRDWCGHVEPAIARFRAALESKGG